MSEPFVGQIQPFGFSFAPGGWAQCDGQLLPIQQNTALFSLLGTTYGGNGQTNFALPDLRGRVPMHFDASFAQGQTGGVESVQLRPAEMPNHNHAFLGTSASADNKRPVTGAAYAQSTTQAQVSPANPYYAPDSNVNTAINPSTVTPVGGSQPHNNLQPYLTVNWCICLAGIFPARG